MLSIQVVFGELVFFITQKFLLKICNTLYVHTSLYNKILENCFIRFKLRFILSIKDLKQIDAAA